MNADHSSILGRQLKIFLGFVVFLSVLWFIYAIRGILAPFALAFVLAYVLAPLVDRMEGRGMDRTWSILLVFLLAIGGLILGVVKAGGTVTDQVGELGDKFLRQESVERKFTISNRGEKSLVVELIDWEDMSVDKPFMMLGGLEFPLRIASGSDLPIHLRFAPADTSLARNILRIRLAHPDIPDPVEVPVRGNASTASGEAFWDQGGHEKKVRLYSVGFSAAGIDFGRAGPNIITNLSDLAAEIQPLIQPLVGAEFDLAEVVKNQGRNLMDTMLGGTTEFLGGIFSGITFLVIVPFVAFFFLKEGHRITHSLIELVPNAYFELCLNLLHQINGQIGGYIRGQILATSVVATLAVGGLYLVDMPYALPLGVIAGLANMIPFLGPLIGIISASIVALAAGGGLALVSKVVIVFLAIQLIDNVLIQPTVVAKSVEMHPLVVLFVVMVGSQLMGIVGMLIAVPLTGILKVSGQTIYQGIKNYRVQ